MPSCRFLFGIAPGGACHAGFVTKTPVGSYPTLSPLPELSGRFTFCCAFRRVTPPGRYPAPLLLGVRTFLEYTRDHPAIRTVCHYCGFDNSSTSNMSANFFIKAQSYPSNTPSKFVRQRLLKACKICSKVASGSKPAR